jgi:HlyD family secretion protein
MKNTLTPRNIIIGLLVLAGLAGGIWGISSYIQSQDSQEMPITASGFVEAVTLNISPEVSGKVISVPVQEGSHVIQGDIMLQIDDTLLQAQREVAAAGVAQAEAAVKTAGTSVDAAKTQFQAALDQAREQEKTYRTLGWMEEAPEGFDLPMWYFDSSERLAALQEELRIAEDDLAQAEQDMKDVENLAASGEFLEAEADLTHALEAFQVAKTVLENAERSGDAGVLLDEAQQLYDRAVSDLEDAQEAYNDALRSDGAQDVLKARARVAIARERVDTVLDRIRMLKTGELSPQVAAARNILDQAQSADEQAQAALSGAKANLALIDAQIAKAVVTAPSDGVVLTRAVEPGAVIGAGGIAFTIARMDRLTITVYVPEDRIGDVVVGMPAILTVDSFPDAEFHATVTHLSDYAEFTPRNVQTVEGRRATVFAVKLALIDGWENLKPGMPADVTFQE